MLHRGRQVDDALALRAWAARRRSPRRTTSLGELQLGAGENISGEYSKVHCVSGCFAASCTAGLPVAMSTMPSSSSPNTTRRITGEVAL
jgi:hypothetical protein